MSTEPAEAFGTHDLHIPYPEWAFTPRSFPHLHEDLLVIQRWANSVTCVAIGEGTDPRWDNGTVTQPFHWPYLEGIIADGDGQLLEVNYLAFERWAATLCHGLHIPYKQWLREDPTMPRGPDHERANLLTIQRWSTTIGECCIQDTGGGGGG